LRTQRIVVPLDVTPRSPSVRQNAPGRTVVAFGVEVGTSFAAGVADEATVDGTGAGSGGWCGLRAARTRRERESRGEDDG
jgi:hypothetical protein